MNWSLSFPVLSVALALFCAGCGASDPAASGAGGTPGAVTGGSAGDAANPGMFGGAGSAGSAGSVTESGGAGAGGSATENGGAAGALLSAGSAGMAHAGSSSAGPPATRQLPKPLGSTSGAPNGYYEYLPPDYDAKAAVPLLVFWHGVGEDGNGGADLHKVLAHGPPALIAKNQWDNARPFIVLSPQHTDTNGAIAPGGGCPSSAEIDAFLRWSATHYAVDAKRIYLTGLSCGAIGSWDYLAEFKGTLVAAALLLSGNPGDPKQAGSAWQRAGCGLGEAAIWSAHGDQDGVVPYAPDHDTQTLLMACPAPPRRAISFTDVVQGQHDIWDTFYDLTAGYGDIYAWLLSNAKP